MWLYVGRVLDELPTGGLAAFRFGDDAQIALILNAAAHRLAGAGYGVAMVEEHAVIGKEMPNVFVNLCWMWAMNPVTAEHTLDSWLASVPHTKILGYGADCGSPFSEYAYAKQARTGIARVLQRWIDRGDMTLADAKTAAADIMLLNGCRLHGLKP
jgi:hypothetical protein